MGKVIQELLLLVGIRFRDIIYVRSCPYIGFGRTLVMHGVAVNFDNHCHTALLVLARRGAESTEMRVDRKLLCVLRVSAMSNAGKPTK